MLRRILLPLSGSSYTPIAIRYAVDMAHRHGARITALSAAASETSRHASTFDRDTASATVAALPRMRRVRHMVHVAIDRLTQHADNNGVPVTLLQDSGSLIDGLIEQWPEHDMVIVGLRGLFEQDILDDASRETRRLLAIAPTPLLAVADYYRPVQRVLIGYDGSPTARQSVYRTLTEPLWPGADHRLVGCATGDNSAIEQLVAHINLPAPFSVEIVPRAQGCADWQALHGLACQWDADVVVMPRGPSTKLVDRNGDGLSRTERTLLMMN